MQYATEDEIIAELERVHHEALALDIEESACDVHTPEEWMQLERKSWRAFRPPRERAQRAPAHGRARTAPTVRLRARIRTRRSARRTRRVRLQRARALSRGGTDDSPPSAPPSAARRTETGATVGDKRDVDPRTPLSDAPRPEVGR
jgi:hypothetical protein